MVKVHVMLADSDKAHTYEGDYDVALGPDACLIVNEMVPNVSAMGPDTLPRVKSIYNSKAWSQVALA